MTDQEKLYEKTLTDTKNWLNVNLKCYGDGKNTNTLNSLERIEFNMAIEDEFGIVVDDDYVLGLINSTEQYASYITTLVCIKRVSSMRRTQPTLSSKEKVIQS